MLFLVIAETKGTVPPATVATLLEEDLEITLDAVERFRAAAAHTPASGSGA